MSPILMKWFVYHLLRITTPLTVVKNGI